jgi:two-component sensor histidine kinase
MKTLFVRIFGSYKSIVFLLAIGLVLSLHLYTQHIIGQLREEARSLVLFYAQMYARVAETESTSDISFIFEQIIRRTNFPLIQTDPDKRPVGWKGIQIQPGDRSEEAMKTVTEMVRHMDREIDPVPIKYKNLVLGYLYYGDSRLIQQLQWLPYIEIGIIGLFILLGFFGYASIKRSEQRHIWVGMAKETAHQLGTPISSLMGWIEIMQSGKSTKKKGIFDEMEKDLRRLKNVTNRFSQIGSKPDLKKIDTEKCLKEVIEYIERRAPHIGKKVKITEDFKQVPAIDLNSGLFQWAVENIMKNSLDAMYKPEGLIHVRLFPENHESKVIIEIEDNGKGIEGSNKNHIFKPGFSTKKRGWGLGLTLAKRIIEEYHRGRLCVKESKTGVGTTMRIELKT